MIKYSDKTKEEALDTYRREGIKIASERFNMPTSTIYRWLSIERRKAMLADIEQDGNGKAPEEKAEKNSEVKPVVIEEPLQEKEVVSHEDDAPDMMTLLIEENEKLRNMNLQLRRALQAFVM